MAHVIIKRIVQLVPREAVKNSQVDSGGIGDQHLSPRPTSKTTKTTLRGYFCDIPQSYKMLQETQFIGVYELDSRYISINLGKLLPLESENAWLCSPLPHSTRGKSLVAMGFQGCLLRAESVSLLRRPGERTLHNRGNVHCSACQSSCTWVWGSACVQMLAVQNPSLAKKAGLWRTAERNSRHLYPLPQRGSTNLGDICRPEKTKPQCQLPFCKDPWPT